MIEKDAIANLSQFVFTRSKFHRVKFPRVKEIIHKIEKTQQMHRKMSEKTKFRHITEILECQKMRS